MNFKYDTHACKNIENICLKKVHANAVITRPSDACYHGYLGAGDASDPMHLTIKSHGLSKLISEKKSNVVLFI